MKTLIQLITVAAALSLVEATSFGEEESTTATTGPAASGLREAGAAVQKAQADVRRIQSEVRERAAQMNAEVAQLRAQLAQAGEPGVPEVPEVPGYGGVGASAGVPPPPGYQSSLRRVLARSGSSTSAGKALVIRSTDSDPATQAALEEDLAVMMHLLNKAIEENVGGAPRERTAMGISVAFAPNLAPNRCLYLDGYGALFMLRVNFPLLGPPAATPEQPKENKPADSSWEEARRELYGQPGQPKVMGDAEQFDAGKVAKLKDALLEALKSATNIRNLKSDDSITLCVLGGAGQRVVTVKPTTGTTAAGTVAFAETRIIGGTGHGSILTIRVRKSDVDAFAKGKLDLDQFRNKAAMATYSGSGGGESWTMY